jgi:multiple sugar transport system permease protein
MVGPVVAIVVALLIYPFVDAILLSFQERFIGQTGTWVGLQNYVNLFNGSDQLFLKALGITFILTGSAIVGKLIIGLTMAAVLNQDIPARNVWRGVMFLPWAVPAVVTAYVWRFLFDTTGPINGAIAEFGVLDDYLYFFNDAKLALPALTLVVIWSGVPFWTMNLLAGMASIPQELYEAAEIDGASRLQRVWFVTLPLLRPAALFVSVVSIAGAFQVFAQVFILTQGGPAYSSSVLAYYLYIMAFQRFQMGYAAAIAMVLLVVSFAVTLAIVINSRRWVHGGGPR